MAGAQRGRRARGGMGAWHVPRDAEERVITLPVAAEAVLAVVADTHGVAHPTALALIRQATPSAILHAGDIGDPAVLNALGPLAPALYAVRGNIDPAGPAGTVHADALVLSLRDGPRERLRILLLHMGVQGPRILDPVKALARTVRADVVVCGHSHVPLVAVDDGLTVLNPGSIGPRRFGLPITFAFMRIGTRVTFEHFDCDRGARWEPRPSHVATATKR